MRKLTRSWQIFCKSLTLIGKEKKLLIFPLLSACAMLLLLVFIIAGIAGVICFAANGSPEGVQAAFADSGTEEHSHRAAAASHPFEQEAQKHPHQRDGKDIVQDHRQQEAGIIRDLLAVILHAVFLKEGLQRIVRLGLPRVVSHLGNRREQPFLGVPFQPDIDLLVIPGNPLGLSFRHQLLEIRVGDLLVGGAVEHLHEKAHAQERHHGRDGQKDQAGLLGIGSAGTPLAAGASLTVSGAAGTAGAAVIRIHMIIHSVDLSFLNRSAQLSTNYRH